MSDSLPAYRTLARLPVCVLGKGRPQHRSPCKPAVETPFWAGAILVVASSQAKYAIIVGNLLLFVFAPTVCVQCLDNERRRLGEKSGYDPSSEGKFKAKGGYEGTKALLYHITSQKRRAHLASSGRIRVIKGARRTWLGRVHRSGGRCCGAIAHRVVRQRLGCPPTGKQCATKPATVRLAPLGWRFRVRFEKLFVLLLLT
jgi:hypothetical protein